MAIHGYDGVPGSGKTSAAVDRLWKARTAGEPVFANIPLYDLRIDKKTGQPINPRTFGWSWAGYIESVEQLMGITSGQVLIDEVDMWFSAVEHQKIDFTARRFWTQHRKNGINLIWCCTHFDRVLVLIRNITNLVFRCHRLPFMKGRSFQKIFDPLETESAKRSSMWRAIKLHPMLWQLYHSNFIVGNGATSAVAGGYKGARQPIESELGAARLGTDIEIHVGDLDEVLHLASTAALFMPAKPGEKQQVAPLMSPSSVMQLLIWCDRIAREGDRAVPTDRVAAARLRSVVAAISGKANSQASAIDGGKLLSGSSRSKIIQYPSEWQRDSAIIHTR